MERIIKLRLALASLLVGDQAFAKNMNYIGETGRMELPTRPNTLVLIRCVFIGNPKERMGAAIRLEATKSRTYDPEGNK